MTTADALMALNLIGAIASAAVLIIVAVFIVLECAATRHRVRR